MMDFHESMRDRESKLTISFPRAEILHFRFMLGKELEERSLSTAIHTNIPMPR